MHFKSKKTPFIILGITAILFSRALLFSFNDPEGPNLLIVAEMAGGVYLLSLVVYLFNLSTSKKFSLAFLLQVITIIGLYFCLI